MRITTVLAGLFLLIGTGFASAVLAQDITEEAFVAVLPLLTQKSFDKKAEAINELAATGDHRTLAVLNAMLAGQLYYRKADDRIVFAEAIDKKYLIIDVLTNEELGTVTKRKIKKVSINNKLRTVLRASIAKLNLTNPDAGQRLAAVKEIYKNLKPEIGPLLLEVLANEDNDDIKEVIGTALSLLAMDDPDKTKRIEAIDKLSNNLSPEVRNKLTQILEKDTDGEFIEVDEEIRIAAASALEGIRFRLSLLGIVEKAFFGLSLGSVLVLAAIGLAITFGVMGVINMAHGELIMLGAYTTYVVQLIMPEHIGLSIFIAIPAAFIVSGLVGIVIERGVIRFLHGRPLETLLATFGISLILQQAVRSIFSPLNRSVSTPEWMSGSLQLGSALSLTYNRLYILIFCLLVFFALLMILKKTSLGLHVRAVSQDRAMARAMGIRTDWVDALTFGLGAGIAGVAGVALSQLTNVGPNLGQSYIIDSFLVVVFGGVGNLWGTMVAGLSIGVANKFMEPMTGAVLAKILILVFIILFIQKRPRGLFPQKGRAVEA